jgi:outer membrane scaffolding protein for murein synthesis (MipA/OmpV family)
MFVRLAPTALAAAFAAATATADPISGPAVDATGTDVRQVVPSFADAPPAVEGPRFSTQGQRERTLIFTALLGARAEPTYFGSDDTRVRPDFKVNLALLNFGALEIGRASGVPRDPNNRRQGFGIGGSFRYVGQRDASGDDDLDGLEDVDPSVELGFQLGYAWPSVETFVDFRYGVTGHESWVTELGANYVARPMDGFMLRVGPRIFYGDEGFAETYFSVDEGEAAASGLPEYEASAGLVSAGVEVIATYRLNDRWWLEGRARYDRLQNDAADSPITRAGSADQGTVSIGVRRAFVLEF